MFKYWLSVSRDGKFLFRTEEDEHVRCLEAAETITNGCPELKVLLYWRETAMYSTEYAKAK